MHAGASAAWLIQSGSSRREEDNSLHCFELVQRNQPACTGHTRTLVP